MEAPLPSVDAEPSMEELLAQEASRGGDYGASENVTMVRRKGKKGAQAWETEDDGTGLVTVKRVPTTSSADSGSFGKKVGDLFGAPTQTSRAEIILEAVDAEEKKLNAEEVQLRSETQSSRAILRQLEKRLVDLEEKITEMEEREAALELDRKRKNTAIDSVVEAKPPTSNNTFFGKLVYSIFGYPQTPETSTQLVRANPEKRKEKPRSMYELWDPKTISELPPYILLVSIGVVAVMIKVVLKKGPVIARG
jgi:hypothetical protein